MDEGKNRFSMNFFQMIGTVDLEKTVSEYRGVVRGKRVAAVWHHDTLRSGHRLFHVWMLEDVAAWQQQRPCDRRPI